MLCCVVWGGVCDFSDFCVTSRTDAKPSDTAADECRFNFAIKREESQAKEQREQYQARLKTAESRLSSRNSNRLGYALQGGGRPNRRQTESHLSLLRDGRGAKEENRRLRSNLSKSERKSHRARGGDVDGDWLLASRW